MARSERFELPTLGFEVRCSIQLSYERICLFQWVGRVPNFLGTNQALTMSAKNNFGGVRIPDLPGGG
jgi:hypothetical protein